MHQYTKFATLQQKYANFRSMNVPKLLQNPTHVSAASGIDMTYYRLPPPPPPLPRGAKTQHLVYRLQLLCSHDIHRARVLQNQKTRVLKCTQEFRYKYTKKEAP